MGSTRRVMVTGSDGYIGSMLCPYLCSLGYEVIGVDTCYFTAAELFSQQILFARGSQYHRLDCDLRDLTVSNLANVDAVIHLAAISNDPMGDFAPELTYEINHQQTVRLAEMAREASVARFLFSSSCIMYGMTDEATVDESSPLAPQTAYAKSKVLAEEDVASMACDSFSPTFIRNGTIYGCSPRMRVDTVLNSLVANAMMSGKVTILSDGTPWRPVVCLEDVVRSFAEFLTAPIELIHNQAFNNGADELNAQVRTLGEIVADVIPDVSLEILGEPDADQRTYRASFSKFQQTFPEFRFHYTPETGARQLYDGLKRFGITQQQIESRKFVRLNRLAELSTTDQINNQLRWTVTRQSSETSPEVVA